MKKKGVHSDGKFGINSDGKQYTSFWLESILLFTYSKDKRINKEKQ